MTILDIWWRSKNSMGLIDDKHFTITFYRHLWKKFGVRTNGARPGIDKNYNWHFWILGLHFDYVNFNYKGKR